MFYAVLFVFYDFLSVQVFLPWNPVKFIVSACLLFSIKLFEMLMFITTKLID